MDDGVKEGEKGWKIATIQQADKRVDLRDLSILSYSFMHIRPRYKLLKLKPRQSHKGKNGNFTPERRKY